MDNEINCTLCEQQYTEQNPPRLLITCGHTFCEGCLNKIVKEKNGCSQIICPEDAEVTDLRDGAVSSIPKNIALLKVIDAKRNNLSFKDCSLEMSKIPNQDLTPEDQDTRDLMDAIGGETYNKQHRNQFSTPSKQQQSPPSQPELCLLHQKPLEVVDIIDLKRICASCAIFGQHKGHEFKSLEEIQNQRNSYYNSILKIMDQKDSIHKRLSNEETCSELMDILDKKKQKIKKEINDKYKKLFDAIQAKQKESFKVLDSVVGKTEGKLKNMMKIDQNMLKKYDSWEEKSYQQIKILEGQDFQSKLELLYTDYDAGDILDQGDKIIQDMEKQEQNLLNEVQVALDTIGVQYNTEIYNHIDFVEIYDESRKKKNRVRVNKIQPTSTANKPTVIKKEDPVNISRHNQDSAKNLLIDSRGSFAPESTENAQKDEESLLQMEEQVEQKKQIVKKPSRKSIGIKESINVEMPPPSPKVEPIIPKDHFIKDENVKPQVKETPQRTERIINKKKINKIKVPQKYEKVLQGLIHDSLQTVDFTNAQLGQNNVVLISQLIRGSKARTIKFIRNKLQDEAVFRMIPFLTHVVTLNLSQNYLTDRVLEILIENRKQLPHIKSIILSQNKIIQRKHKTKIDKLRKLEVTVSV